MGGLKTQANDGDVEAFLDSVPDEQRRSDARAVCALLGKVTKAEPVMWGDAIIGFGERRLVYASRRAVDWMVLGFSPRKTSTTIYLHGATEEYAEILGRLGKHKATGGCLHLARLSDVDAVVLEELLRTSYERGRAA